MFTACENKGFQITFPNEWTVSIQWGPFNYCENKSFDDAYNEPSKRLTWNCPDAEIAAWDGAGKWYEFENDTVQGHVTPAEALEFMNMIAGK